MLIRLRTPLQVVAGTAASIEDLACILTIYSLETEGVSLRTGNKFHNLNITAQSNHIIGNRNSYCLTIIVAISSGDSNISAGRSDNDLVTGLQAAKVDNQARSIFRCCKSSGSHQAQNHDHAEDHAQNFCDLLHF